MCKPATLKEGGWGCRLLLLSLPSLPIPLCGSLLDTYAELWDSLEHRLKITKVEKRLGVRRIGQYNTGGCLAM